MQHYLPKALRALAVLSLLAVISGCSFLTAQEGPPPARQELPFDVEVGRAHYLRGMYFKTNGDNLRAAQEFEWSIKADPYNYKAHYQAGLTYLAMNQVDYAYQAWWRGLDMAEDGVDRVDNPRGKAVAEMHAALAGISPPSSPMPYGDYQPEYVAPLPSHVEPEPLRRPTEPLPPPPSSRPEPTISGSGAAPGPAPAYTPPPAGSKPAPTGPQPKPYVPAKSSAPSAKPAAAPKATTAKNPPLIPSGSITGPFAVLVSSNRQAASAANDIARLQKLGYEAKLSVSKDAKGVTWHRVVVGCCSGESKAKALAAELQKKGLAKKPLLIKPEK